MLHYRASKLSGDPFTGGSMILVRLFNEKLAQTSWLIGDDETRQAVVVDPNRDPASYMAAAQKEDVRIVAVTETHIHADFVSGSRELAKRAGAKLYLSDMGEAPWKYAFAESDGAVLLSEGDVIEVGSIRLHAVHTPGHTPEHLSFVVIDTSVSKVPIGLLTGDFIFAGDVGRPDLLEKSAGVSGGAQEGARALFASMQKLKGCPDYAQLWPGHGSGSACGKGINAMPQTTLGYERATSHAFGYRNEDAFIAGVLEGQTDPPPYFAHMKNVNRAGPETLSGRERAARVSVKQIAEIVSKGGLVVDTRPTADFANEHIPGTINIPFNKAFLGWVGWLVPVDADICLIIDARKGGGIDEAVRDLAMIGMERVTAWTGHTVIDTWKSDGRAVEQTPQMSVEELRAKIADGSVHVVDVRNPGEWQDGHIPGVKNVPLGVIGGRAGEIPNEKPVVVHCQGGTRSSIAASVLQARGVKDVINLTGGFGAYTKAGGEIERGGEK